MSVNRFIEVFRPVIYEDSIQEAVRTLKSGWIGPGPKIREFEEKFARYIGSKHCIAVNSGTSALHIALKCLNLPEKSMIVTSPINYVSAVHTIFYENFIPSFVDVERLTGNMLVAGIKKRLKGDIRAILCTHLGGYPCDLKELKDLANTYGIPLIEDCAHAIGSSYKGERIGIGPLCCFSFSFPKAVTGVEGGAIVTGEDEYAERARVLRNLGIHHKKRAPVKEREKEWNNHSHIEEVGFRYNWNDVMASIALKQLNHLEEENNRRKQIAERYMSELADFNGVSLPRYKPDRNSSYFFLPLFFERRNALVKKLHSHGIGSRVYFKRYDRCYLHKPKLDRLPNAEWYSRHELTLPINTSLTEKEVGYIIDTVKKGW